MLLPNYIYFIQQRQPKSTNVCSFLYVMKPLICICTEWSAVFWRLFWNIISCLMMYHISEDSWWRQEPLGLQDLVWPALLPWSVAPVPGDKNIWSCLWSRPSVSTLDFTFSWDQLETKCIIKLETPCTVLSTTNLTNIFEMFVFYLTIMLDQLYTIKLLP